MDATTHDPIARFLHLDADRTRTALAALLFALVGLELVVLVSWLPDTVQTWWQANPRGDFGDFYRAAQELRPNGLYSPALSLLLYPLTFLSEAAAYRIYLSVGAVCWLGVAYLAQRAVPSPEGRLAVVLGILSVPQLHWALRLGHLTPVLALVALGGLLLLKRRPVLAGLCLALLVLKPQYAPLPALYLLWSRNRPALLAFAGGALALELAGFAFAGFGEVGPYFHRFLDWGADSSDNLVPLQKTWQYAWPGFLVSLGIEPHPLVVFDLVLVSAGAVWLAWARSRTSAALATVALGMLIVTPYANFYDWGLLVVGAALLLRADTAGRPVALAGAAGLYGALVWCMHATPFPVTDLTFQLSGTSGNLELVDTIVPTNGVYFVTPLVLALVAYLALSGRRYGEAPALEPAARAPLRAPRFVAAMALVPLVYFATAFVAEAPPFTHQFDPYAPSEVLKQVPEDFPLPPDGALRDAGQGEQLPYHVEWTSEEPVSEVAGIYRRLVDGPGWDLMLQEEESPSYRIRLARYSQIGTLSHWAMLDVSPQGAGSRISLDLYVTETLSVVFPAAPQP